MQSLHHANRKSRSDCLQLIICIKCEITSCLSAESLSYQEDAAGNSASVVQFV